MLIRGDGVDLDVGVTGPAGGPLVVLLHGFPIGSRSWHRTAPALAAAGFRVAVPDQRGYGASDQPRDVAAYGKAHLVADVLAIADRLGAPRFRLVGHDFGGAVAWSVAQDHPERVERLAVLNCPHPDVFGLALRHDPGQLARSWYIALFQLPGLAERVLAARGARAMTALLAGSAAAGTFPPDEVAALVREWTAPGALRPRIHWYRAAARVPSPPPRRFHVDVPTLLVWGDRDTALRPTLAEPSIAMAPGGRLAHVPEAGHWPQLEAPDTVNELLVEHLR